MACEVMKKKIVHGTGKTVEELRAEMLASLLAAGDDKRTAQRKVDAWASCFDVLEEVDA